MLPSKCLDNTSLLEIMRKGSWPKAMLSVTEREVWHPRNLTGSQTSLQWPMWIVIKVVAFGVNLLYLSPVSPSYWLCDLGQVT